MSDSKSSAASAKPKAIKPRAGIVRKSKAERDAHAKQEAEKAAARAAAAAQSAGKPTQTRPSGKKRDTVRDQKDSGQGGLGGVFGAGSGLRQNRTRANNVGYSEVLEGQQAARPSEGPVLQGQEGGSGGQGGTGGGGTGTGSGTRRNTSSRLGAGGHQVESDNEPDEERCDIERIPISSDEADTEEDDALTTTKGKGRAISEGRKLKQSLALRPVRAPRLLAEDPEAEVERKEKKRTSRSHREDAGDAEKQDNVDRMEVNDDSEELARVKPDPPSSPELSKRVKLGKKVGPRTKDVKFGTATLEERAEQTRLDEDIEKLRDEFVIPRKIKTKKDGDQDEEHTKHDGKLFLFQFPPLVPFLVDPLATSVDRLHNNPTTTEDGQPIKSDPDAPGATAATMGAADGEASKTTATLQPQIEGLLTANDRVRLPPGHVGKLRIHKSGKVTMDWGGTDMEVRYGTEVDFLQDAVLVETHRQSDNGEERPRDAHTGSTYALGQVQKKMIVIPDWQKLYD